MKSSWTPTSRSPRLTSGAKSMHKTVLHKMNEWMKVGLQARAEELTDHEEQLEAWKQKFKAEALRQIGEREKALSDWQSKLDRKKNELEELQRSMEVRQGLHDLESKSNDNTIAQRNCYPAALLCSEHCAATEHFCNTKSSAINSRPLPMCRKHSRIVMRPFCTRRGPSVKACEASRSALLL